MPGALSETSLEAEPLFFFKGKMWGKGDNAETKLKDIIPGPVLRVGEGVLRIGGGDSS